VYQPYGVIATIRMKHAMRMPIVMRYFVKRAPASSCGARGTDVVDWGFAVDFTMHPAYAA
jgi:hypothetical protein